MKFNRFLASVLAVTVVGANMPAAFVDFPKISMTANAEATVPSDLTLVAKGSEGDFSCNYYSDGSLLIDGYFGKESVVTIPESINGKKVRSFLIDFYYFGITITDVYVPNSVALIDSIGSTYKTYTYLDAYKIMYNNGITLHMAGYDIPSPAPESYLKYETLDDGTIEITGCDKNITKAEIPSEINGIKVTSIGKLAFLCCSKLTSITIPDSVTSIDYGAFEACDGLTEITIPDSVTSIDYMAFSSCSKLAEITIPDSVTSIGDRAFELCSSLTEITIPDSVTSIGSDTFYFCSSLTSITIPDSVTSIGSDTFYFCSSLTSITIPDSVTSIGHWAFHGTPWLENKRKENPLVMVNGILIDGITCSGDVVIPDNITNIGSGAFTKNIGEGVVGGCSELTSITIPDSVTSIGDRAFQSCEGLTSITIPDSITSIGEFAFCACTGLEKITILNPNCEIYGSEYTILNSHDYDYDNGDHIYYFNGTIYGYENSTAQAYAEKYNKKFESLGEAPATELATGDVNGDNTVDSSDASAILVDYSLTSTGKESTLTDAQKAAADIDKDGKIDSSDASFILSYYSYISTGGTETDMSKWFKK